MTTYEPPPPPDEPPRGASVSGSQLAEGAQQVAAVSAQLETIVKQAPVSGLNKGKIVTVLGGIAALAAALAPALANLDFASTGGLVGGVLALAAVVTKWLDGWQKYEQDVRDPTKFNEPAP